MSCAISALSSRTVHFASATTRSFTSRSSSSSNAIQRSSQGNVNSQRSRPAPKKINENNARSLSSLPPQWYEDGSKSSIWRLKASALLTGGAVAAYVAYDHLQDETQCSSLGVMDSGRDLSPATMFKSATTGYELRRYLTESDSTSQDADLKSTSFENTRRTTIGVNSGSTSKAGAFNTMERGPASSLKTGMLDVVEASVNKASAWEKKAKAAVNLLRNPSRYDLSVRALRGGRLSMEDMYCVHDGGRFAGVFDGHGGAMVSRYTSDTIYDKIKKYLAVESEAAHPSIGALVKSISSAFDELNDEVLSVDDYQYQGSTAVAVYVHEDEVTKERTIVSANVGDSRAVLARGSRAVSLTRDHKPDDEHEKKRILSMGETIEWDPYCQVSRVKNLSLSRAIGDRFAKPVVSGEVEIQLFPLSDLPCKTGDEDDFIVLASDGLWDVMTSQNCVDYATKRLNPTSAQVKSMSKRELLQHKISRRKNMSRFMANEAMRRGSCDNICVVIIWLNEPKGVTEDLTKR